MNIRIPGNSIPAIVPQLPWSHFGGVTSRFLGPNQRATFSTGICLEVPEGFVGLIWPRSGLSVKKGIDVLAGVVDSGYRGEVKVCLLNTGHEWLEVEEGDRICDRYEQHRMYRP